MELARGLNNWRQYNQGCAVTIGNFDGVHLGHQAIFRQLVNDAAARDLPAVVISFEPLPHEFFNPAAEQLRLQTFRDRLGSIADCNIDRLLLLRFNQRFASQGPNEFIQHTLVDTLGVRHLLVGDDFRFGARRAGDISLLRKAASPGGFTVSDTATVALNSGRISSTGVRELLQQGNCMDAAELLGRPHRISGRVIHGEKVGRQLGFPTANVCLKNHRPLLRGVFAVTATRLSTPAVSLVPGNAGDSARGNPGQSFPAVANLGERPTVGGRKLLLEVHLLDQNEDLYGERLAVDFHHRIRGEKKFASLDELKSAIASDAESAREILAGRQ